MSRMPLPGCGSIPSIRSQSDLPESSTYPSSVNFSTLQALPDRADTLCGLEQAAKYSNSQPCRESRSAANALAERQTAPLPSIHPIQTNPVQSVLRLFKAERSPYPTVSSTINTTAERHHADISNNVCQISL